MHEAASGQRTGRAHSSSDDPSNGKCRRARGAAPERSRDQVDRLKDVRRLAELLRESPEIGSIEVKGWFGTGVVITRTVGGVPTAVPLPRRRAARAAAPAARPAGPAAERPRPPRPPPALKEIRSPMVGHVLQGARAGRRAVRQGRHPGHAGQTVCIIEAMKIMNEIEAEIAGVVREVCVEDAQPVEFGQVLFRVDPNG